MDGIIHTGNHRPGCHTATEEHALRLQHICSYLAEYASMMLGAGSSCIRITRNMDRMVRTIGLTADMIILPNHISITLLDSDNIHMSHASRSIAHVPVSFSLITALSKLSWKVAEGKFTILESERVYRQLVSNATTVDPRMLIWLVAAANASFCRLFGGDWQAVGLVALATLAGYAAKLFLVRRHLDYKFIVILCAFLSSLIGSLGYMLHLGTTPDVALGTSVLYLIPGIIYINGVSDLLAGHYLCWLSRTMHSVILTSCIAIGLTLGYLVMNIKVFGV